MQFKVEHFGLPAQNPAALKDWYLSTLGAELVFSTDSAYFVKLDHLVFEIYEADFTLEETADNKLAGYRHLALLIDSLAEAKTLLESRGVKFRENVKPAGGGGRVIFFSDPEGNLLNLVERPEKFKL